MRLKGKNILLAVGGGIAAYKVPSLLRLLQKEGATVRVFMSPSAHHFVTPYLLQTLSGNPVESDLFTAHDPFLHINASKNADLFLIAPATAQMLAQFAHGFASDLISATVLATSCPVLLVPSMNTRMWNNALVQKNVDILRKNEVWVVNPGKGDLACGEVGEGRLPDLEVIVDEVKRSLTASTLEGKKVLLTAGPTYEFLDPIRFLSNRSSGKMGLSLALEAYYRGAEVTLITGCRYRSLPAKVTVIPVASAKEMEKEVLTRAQTTDLFIANAAVSDYRFSQTLSQKLKKDKDELELRFIRNPDILSTVSQKRGKLRKPFIVGFALETAADEQEKAHQKFRQKKLDLMVLNNLSALDSDTATVTFIFGRKKQKFLPFGPKSKTEVAQHIFDQILALKPF